MTKTCPDCGHFLVRDGTAWLFQGTRLIHVPGTCSMIRQRVDGYWRSDPRLAHHFGKAKG